MQTNTLQISDDLGFISVDEPGMGHLEIWHLPTDEEFLWGFFHDLFRNWWQDFEYGILVQGGVLEFRPPCEPTKVARLDGYLTVEFGNAGHLHLCIGTTTGLGCYPTPPGVAKVRKPSALQLYRKLNGKGQPTFWAIRTFNSHEPDPEQTLQIYLPNPLLTETMEHATPPDWSKLKLWNYLRSAYLGLPEDPRDTTALRFSHD